LLTEEQIDWVLQGLRAGLSRIHAANFAQVPFAEVATFIREDPDFQMKCKRAEAEFRLRCLAAVQKASQPRDVVTVTRRRAVDGSTIETTKTEPVIDWKAAAWLLQNNGN